MSLTHRLTTFAFAALAALGLSALNGTAQAQSGGVDFLWGGSSEFGGGRQLVSFSPQYKPGQIIVSFSDRRLYHVVRPGQAMTYPVAVPTGEARWQGTTFISDKRINPAWTPTPEMISKNPRLPRWVPGGHPLNPLGVRAMYLGSSAYRIHGTDAPWTIGQAVSHGCIRMLNEDVIELYPKLPVGTRVTVTWQHFNTGGAVASSSSADEKPARAQRKTYRTSSGQSQGQPMRRYMRPATSLQKTSAAE
jgi:lipoprotein-anchoring transpeptidase ErfK/SrfK